MNQRLKLVLSSQASQPQSDSERKPLGELLPTLTQGESSHAVRVLKALLGLAGEDLHDTEAFDLATHKAVARIQRKRDLLSPVPGQCDTWVWVSLLTRGGE